MNLRSVVFCVVFGVVVFGFFGLLNPGAKSGNAQEVTYSQLLGKIDTGHVKHAVLRGESIDAYDADNHVYSAVTPSNQDDLVKRLEANGADIQVKPPGGVTM